MFSPHPDDTPAGSTLAAHPTAVLARGLELLRAAADLLGSVDAAEVPDTSLGDALVTWDTLTNQLDAARVRCTHTWDARSTWSADGAGSGAAWLVGHTHQARAEAASTLRLGRSLTDMPGTDTAFAHGTISTTKARLLADAAKAAPEAFRQDEDMLVGHARSLTVDNLRRSLAYWRVCARPDDEARRTARQHDERHVSLSRTFEGTWRLDGILTPEDGEILDDALTRLARARYRAEQGDVQVAGGLVTSTAGQRRADAIVDLARQVLTDEHGTGVHASAVTALVDLVKLGAKTTGAHDPVGTTGGGTPLTATQVRRLLCDAQISRVVTDGRSSPVDLGTAVRLPTPSQRRALAVRDGGCTFPGCDRPPGWCQAHHLVHWADGGTTDLDNLTLLCSFHHHLVHEGGFSLHRRSDGSLSCLRPDGTSLTVPRVTRVPSPFGQLVQV